LPMREMPDDLRALLAEADLVMAKGALIMASATLCPTPPNVLIELYSLGQNFRR
jgi:hypothetical protein